MQPREYKRIIVVALPVLVVLIFVGFIIVRSLPKREPVVVVPEEVNEVVERIEWPEHKVIGTSIEGRDISAYTYGTGTTTLLFVGGMHGGYEWNSSLLAYQFMDYFKTNYKEAVPSNLRIIIIPNANPDGMYKVVGKEGRFSELDVNESQEVQVSGRQNANGVDLNRNFDCKWQAKATWRSNPVSAGTSAFSEPEAVAIRDIVLASKPSAVVFWHSQAGAVYASACEDDTAQETLDIMNAYAEAANYDAVASFDAYPITGDAEGWLASIGIPAVTVEMTNHTDVEWDNNLAGVKALMNYYVLR